MGQNKFDVLVLGAGIVGVSAAVHLQQAGLSVALLDRHAEAACETSFGNTGIVQSEAVFPYMLPHAPREILAAALNLDPRVQIRYRALPALAPWLWRYFQASRPAVRTRTALAMRQLVLSSNSEHLALAQAAGAASLLRAGGWIKIYRSPRGFEMAQQDAQETKPFGIASQMLDRQALTALEPHLSPRAIGGVHYLEPLTSSDPAALTRAYAALFVRRGGRFVQGEARSLQTTGDAWRATCTQGAVEAARAVVALGPWSAQIADMFGYRLPFGVKRGYHMHYGAAPGASLTRPVLDLEKGYVITPMARGIRLTSGAEFARLDDPPSSRHIDRLEPLARELFPLAERRDSQVWLGQRPCLPDMAPVIGPAPRHKGLWFNFGHQHLGLTLGPVCGRLLAEMMTGQAPLTDPQAFRLARFE